MNKIAYRKEYGLRFLLERVPEWHVFPTVVVVPSGGVVAIAWLNRYVGISWWEWSRT